MWGHEQVKILLERVARKSATCRGEASSGRAFCVTLAASSAERSAFPGESKGTIVALAIITVDTPCVRDGHRICTIAEGVLYQKQIRSIPPSESARSRSARVPWGFEIYLCNPRNPQLRIPYEAPTASACSARMARRFRSRILMKRPSVVGIDGSKSNRLRRRGGIDTKGGRAFDHTDAAEIMIRSMRASCVLRRRRGVLLTGAERNFLKIVRLLSIAAVSCALGGTRSAARSLRGCFRLA